MVGEKMGKGMGKKGRVSPFLFLTFFSKFTLLEMAQVIT